MQHKRRKNSQLLEVLDKVRVRVRVGDRLRNRVRVGVKVVIIGLGGVVP